MQPASAGAPPPDNDIVLLLQREALDLALTLLLERYEAKVYRLCWSMLRNETQAEDAAQESWVRIWKALPRFDQRASLSTWIYAITRNRCLTALNRRRSEVTSGDEETEVDVAAMKAVQPYTEDLWQLMHELIELLPEHYRRILTLYYYEDQSVAEVAEMLTIPIGTVKTLLFRARAALAKQLKARGLNDPQAWWGSPS